jgi:hypothetical protein
MKSVLHLKSVLGFTLIEVALAAAIIGVGFVGMIEALAIGSEMLDTARKQTIAAQIMQSEIEYLRLQDWDTMLSQLTNQSQKALTENPANPNGNSGYRHLFGTSLASMPYRSLKYGWEVVTLRTANPDGTGPPILRQVTITVTWASVTGKPHVRSSSVYIGKYGLNVPYQKL